MNRPTPVASIEREELERFRRENRELKQVNDILKLASDLVRERTRDTTDRWTHRPVPPGGRVAAMRHELTGRWPARDAADCGDGEHEAHSGADVLVSDFGDFGGAAVE